MSICTDRVSTLTSDLEEHACLNGQILELDPISALPLIPLSFSLAPPGRTGRTGQLADIEKSPIYLFSFYNLPSDRKFR